MVAGSPRVTRDTFSVRVIHVAPTGFGDAGLYGGGERYPLELCRALAQRIECRLVTFGSTPGSFTENGGLERVVLRPALLARGHPAHPVGGGLLSATSDATIVHVHQMRSAPSRVGALAALIRGQRRVVTDHGLGGGGWGGLLPRLFDRFACVSRYSAKTLRAPPAKTRIIYGGADTNRYRPGHEARSGVLFVGRLTPHKGVDKLIEALPTEASLTVCGTSGHDRRPPESTYPGVLRCLARGRAVSFRERISDDELSVLYRRAAVFVLPSVYETRFGRHVEISELLGLSALEAMASATPVVCTRVGGLSEVVRDGETGFVTEPGNVEELRDRITTLLREPALAGKMGQAARRLVLDSFTWASCAQRCVDIYRELEAR
jgi:glycosyltransferase involved in cell wall biosynthesis